MRSQAYRRYNVEWANAERMGSSIEICGHGPQGGVEVSMSIEDALQISMQIIEQCLDVLTRADAEG